MHLIDYLSPQSIRTKVKAPSKKRAFEMASEVAAKQLGNPDLTLSILESLLSREKLGGTGIGHGVGIPHCRLAELDQPLIVMLQLDQAIDYNSIDQQPVDIILALFVPTEAIDIHLMILAAIAENVSQPEFLHAVRTATNPEALYALMAAIKND